jgi:hypothetical protein
VQCWSRVRACLTRYRMAKGLRSKIRKHWASERRRTIGKETGRDRKLLHQCPSQQQTSLVHDAGMPVEQKQLEEQAKRLKESLEKQSEADPMATSVLHPPTPVSPGPPSVESRPRAHGHAWPSAMHTPQLKLRPGAAPRPTHRLAAVDPARQGRVPAANTAPRPGAPAPQDEGQLFNLP